MFPVISRGGGFYGPYKCVSTDASTSVCSPVYTQLSSTSTAYYFVQGFNSVFVIFPFILGIGLFLVGLSFAYKGIKKFIV